MHSHSNAVTLLLSSHMSARSWTISWLAIPPWSHWQKSQQHQAPFSQWHCPSRVVPSLPQQSTASDKANPSASSFYINGQTASHSHAGITQSSWGLQDQTFSFQGQTQNNTWNYSARPLFPLEPLTAVSTESRCSHPGPTFSPEPAATLPSSSCHGSARGHSAQHHGWHLLQQSSIGHPPSHRASTIWFIVSY